jgi:hypothetical protein
MARSLENMLNSERRLPKREALWNPWFDIVVCAVSLFSDEQYRPARWRPTRRVNIGLLHGHVVSWRKRARAPPGTGQKRCNAMR